MATYTRNTGAIPPAAVNKSVPALPSQDLSSIIISSFNTVKENMDDIKDVTKTGSQRIITNTNGVEDAQLVTQENEKKLVETISKQNEKHNSEKARNTQEIEKKDSEEKKKKEDKKQSVEEAKQELERKHRVERYEAMVSKTEGALAGWTRNPLAGTSQLIDKGIQKVGGKALSILNTPIGELGDSLREKASSIPFFGKYFKKNDDEKDKNEKDTKVSNVDKALKVMESSNERTVARLEKLIESFTGGEDKPSKLLPAEKNENNDNILEKYKAILETEKGSVAEKYGNSEPKKSVTEAALEDKDKDEERESRKLQMSELIKADDERKKNEKSRNKNEKDNKEIKENTMASKIAQQSIAQIVTKISAVVLGLGVLAVAVPVILDHILDWYLDFKALPGKWKAEIRRTITVLSNNIKMSAAELLSKVEILGQKIFQQETLSGADKGKDIIIKQLVEGYNQGYMSEDEAYQGTVAKINYDRRKETEKNVGKDWEGKYNSAMVRVAGLSGIEAGTAEYIEFQNKMETDETFRNEQLAKYGAEKGEKQLERVTENLSRKQKAEEINAKYDAMLDEEKTKHDERIASLNEGYLGFETQASAFEASEDYKKMSDEERKGVDEILAKLRAGELFKVGSDGKYVISEKGLEEQKRLDEKRYNIEYIDENSTQVKEQFQADLLKGIKNEIIAAGGRSSEMQNRDITEFAKATGMTESEARTKITQARSEWAAEWQGTGKNPFLDYDVKYTSEKLKDVTHPVVEALDKTTKAIKEATWGVNKTVDGKDINVAVRDIQVRDGTPITN